MRTVKIMMTAIAAIAAISMARAEHKTVTADQLPAKAQQFLKTYFASQTPNAKIGHDSVAKSYDVTFADGGKVEFDDKGEWKKVDCGKVKIPAGIVPAQIVTAVNSKYPGQDIVKIDRDKDKKDYKVGLADGTEAKFDPNFKEVKSDEHDK